MESSSDSLDGLSVSAFGKGVTTNDLTTDSQGTYCELGEQSQQMGSQDLFLGSQDSHPSSISLLEQSNPNIKSYRESGHEFSNINTASTPLTKRKRETRKGEGQKSSDSSSERERKSKLTCPDNEVKDSTILISSVSGDNSQLNFSQLDTQMKILTDVDDLEAGNGDVPCMKSLSSSNGLNHSTELHNLSSNSYNSHQIRNATLAEKRGNKKTISKEYTVMVPVTFKEVRCESSNQLLALYQTEVTPPNQHQNLSPLLNKLVPSASSSTVPSRESLSSGGSVFSAVSGALFPLRGTTHEQRISLVSSSSSGTVASSAASLAFRQQAHLQRLIPKDGLPPVQCINCNYKFKAPILPPPSLSTPDLLSSGPENISSSVCEDEPRTPPAKTDAPVTSPPRPPENKPPDYTPETKLSPTVIPILQATRRSSFNKKFTTLELIKEETKHSTGVPSVSAVMTPKSSVVKGRRRGPRTKKPDLKSLKTSKLMKPDKAEAGTEEVDEGEVGGSRKEEVEKKESEEQSEEENEVALSSRVESAKKKVRARSAPKKKVAKREEARRTADRSEREVQRTRRQLISRPGEDDVPETAVEENMKPLPNIMAANVYDPGKTILAIWSDKLYYPAVIQADLQSFLRVKYLDGFVKKIIKQQTIPMSVLYEDTPVLVVLDENLKCAKLKAFEEETRVCTVEWADTSLVESVPLESLRMISDHVKAIQNKYTHVLESPKLHQLTLDNVLQRKRTPARRPDSDEYSSVSSQSSSRTNTSSHSSTRESSESKRGSKKSTHTPAKSDHRLPTVEEYLNTSTQSVPATGGGKGRPPGKVSASTGKKKVLKEKVDNSGNRGVKCRQRIFSVDSESAPGDSKLRKTPSVKASKQSCGPPAKRRRKSGPDPCSSPQPSCSKSKPGDNTENKVKYRWEIEVTNEEYCPSSDSEHELESINMSGFDMDFVQSETDNECPGEIVSNKTVDKLCGPIPAPSHDLFSGYVFVISHCASELPCDSDGNQSDQQYAEWTRKFPFRRRRLEEQLFKGRGTVYPSLNLVPHDQLEHTLLITDRPSTTCNFLLALAMRVPVLHYYYVIQCCVNKSHIKKYRLPEMSSGYSLEEKCCQDRNLTAVNILADYFIVIAMSAKSHAVIFWEKLLRFAGATVKRYCTSGFDWDSIDKQARNQHFHVAILVDDDIPEEILAQPYDRILPTWVIQSLIHAKAREFNAHPAYKQKLEYGSQRLNTSDTY